MSPKHGRSEDRAFSDISAERHQHLEAPARTESAPPHQLKVGHKRSIQSSPSNRVSFANAENNSNCEAPMTTQLSRCDTQRKALLHSGTKKMDRPSQGATKKQKSSNTEYSSSGTRFRTQGTKLTFERSGRATGGLKELRSFRNERGFLAVASRKSPIAQTFHVRAQSDPVDEYNQLHQIFPVDGQDQWPAQPAKFRLSAMGSQSVMYRAMLKVLAITMVSISSFLLALEPMCVEAGREYEMQTIFVLRIVHVICVASYAVLALPGRMLFSIAKPGKDLEIMETQQILKYHIHDFRTWLDAVSSLSFISNFRALDDLGPLRWGLLLDLGRGWRLFEKSTWTSQKSYFEQVAKLALYFAMLCHYGSCIWIALTIPGTSSTWPKPNWAQNRIPDLHQKGCNQLYGASLYFIAKTFTATGYGDTYPTNADERFLTVVLMLIGAVVLAKIVADLTWITKTYNHWTAEHFSRLTQMSAALDGLGFSDSLRLRVLSYQQYTKLMAKERAVRRFFDDLSLPLQTELLLAIYHDLVINASLFARQPLEVIRLVVGALNDRVYMPMDYIFFIGSDGDELYLVRNGVVAILTSEGPHAEPCAEKVVGDHFGEVAVILGTKRSSWAMAQTYVVTSVLHKDVIDDLQVKHPYAFVNLVREVRRTCNLQPQVTLRKVGDLFAERFEDSADAFACIIRAHPNSRAISAADFVQAMLDLEISRLDALLHWSEVDEDQSGSIDYEEFCTIFTAIDDSDDDGEDDCGNDEEEANEEQQQQKNGKLAGWVKAEEKKRSVEPIEGINALEGSAKVLPLDFEAPQSSVSFNEQTSEVFYEKDDSKSTITTSQRDSRDSDKSDDFKKQDPSSSLPLPAIKKKSGTDSRSNSNTLKKARFSQEVRKERKKSTNSDVSRASRDRKRLQRSSSMKRTPLSELGAALERWRVQGLQSNGKDYEFGMQRPSVEAASSAEPKELLRQEVFRREAKAGLKPTQRRLQEEVQTLRVQTSKVRNHVQMLLDQKAKEKQEKSSKEACSSGTQTTSEACSSGTQTTARATTPEERNPQTGEDAKSVDDLAVEEV